MARTNVYLSDDLYAIVEREAAAAEITVASYVRECVAWRVGRLEADDLERRLARVERKLGVEALKRRSPATALGDDGAACRV